MQATVIDSDSRAELAERLERLERQLERALSPAQYQLVRRYRELLEERAGCKADDYGDEVVDSIVRHFPGLAPAIRAIAMHQIDEPDLCAETCRLDNTGPLTIVS